MRLEAGGMASLELIEEVVPVQHLPVEADVSRLLEGGHDPPIHSWPPRLHWLPS